MGSDDSDGGHRSRRRKHGDDDAESRGDRKRPHRDDGSERREHHRHRARDGGRRDEDEERSHRERPKRSRSPDSSRRHRSRDKEGGDSGHDRDRRRRGSPDDRRPRRHRDRDGGREEDSDAEKREERKRRRRRESPHESGSRRKGGGREEGRGGDKDREEGDSRKSLVKRGGPLPTQDASFAVSRGEEPEKPKEMPNFGSSGALAAASNSVAQADGSTITLKYHEPPEARKPPPKDQWKLFVFKGPDIVDTIDLNGRTCWLVGREMAVVDLPAEHPSISKQHAVIQFRHTEKRNEFGDRIGKVKPYLIDLESANGTKLNSDKVPDSRYLELRDKDMIQFGQSTREYVLMLAPRE